MFRHPLDAPNKNYRENRSRGEGHQGGHHVVGRRRQEQLYRGQSNKADASIATAFAGHMMIELSAGVFAASKRRVGISAHG